MSEVLSGSDTERAATRFALFPADERQALRIGRLLMAAGTSLLACVALFVCAFLELLPWAVAIQGTAGIVMLIVLFYVLFRTGLNLRFADPSLTAEQVGTAILFLAYIMYHAGDARQAFTLFYPVAMLFGVLRLNAARLMVLAILALGAHGTMLHLSYLRDPDMDTRAALTQFAVLMIVLPWFAVMGGYVNRLRVRLSGSHRDLQHAFGRIEQLAIRDELTGIYNRRFLMEALQRERARAERTGTSFSICIFDLDHFKSINDSLGHAAGDGVLKRFAQLAPRELRAIDVFGRFGGEEFMVILPGTDARGAVACAERVRQRLESSTLTELAGRRATVTAGAATHQRGEDLVALLARADEALYLGKARGRNRVVTIG
ncbi:MAG TPA: GGDEF domain-containing protein [Burkholderiales bacterium]|nr:GGDEF domain-containing protein [Burkholderiales bacterium]